MDDWTPGNAPPPHNEPVATMDSHGKVSILRYQEGLWYFPDFSMYVYYTPQFWKELD